MQTPFRFDRIFEESLELLEEDMENMARSLNALPSETEWTQDQLDTLVLVRRQAQLLRDAAQRWVHSLLGQKK